MTENSDEQYGARTLHTRDRLSGEELLIAYFPMAGAVTINGYSVTRSLGRGGAGQVVFYRAFDDKLFTVATDSLRELFF